MTDKFLPIGFVLRSPLAEYKIIKVLGSGGFGITYLAVTTVRLGNISTQMKVAIKEHFLSDDCERNDTAQVSYSKPAAERVRNSKSDFVAEARRLHKVGVEHPNVVKVNEVFEANNTAYYVMEYLDGQSLRAYVDARGHLSTDEALQLLRPVIEAVGYLHENRITHLDIKPDNVMLRDAGGSVPTAVLIDFGLSKHYNEDSTPTSTINTLGYSEGYSPIEQYAGIRTFSPVSDIYSLGATMYYVLTGKVPPAATEVEISALHSELMAVTTAGMADAVCAAMQMRAKDRPATCRLWLDMIDGTANDSLATRTIPLAEQAAAQAETAVIEDTQYSQPYQNLQTDPDSQDSQSLQHSYEDEAEPEPRRSLAWLWCLLALLVVGGGAWAYYQFVYLPGDKKVANVDEQASYDLQANGSFNPDANELGTGSQQLIEPIQEEELVSAVSPVTEIQIVPEDEVVNTIETVEDIAQLTHNESGNNEVHSTTVEQEAQRPVEDNTLYSVGSVEQKPYFNGGDAALLKWLSEHINYPASAVEENVQGRVHVSFVISKDGSVSDVKVVRGKHPALDKEAVRVVKSMPRWNPGKQNGVPVRCTYILPVTFKLQ